jgi:5-methylcytosine-specific restriction protein A
MARRLGSSERGYTSKWQKARADFLQRFPRCMTRGCNSVASIVDHAVPHKGNDALFWDRSNWRARCKSCHDAKTAREDGGFGNPVRRGAVARGVDRNGKPRDPRHPWNAGRRPPDEKGQG